MLADYDGSRPVKLITDASPHGVGAVLMQVGEEGAERPVRFASRSLARAEKAYSQFDREGLAVIFGVARYKQYQWGRKITRILHVLARAYAPAYTSRAGYNVKSIPQSKFARLFAHVCSSCKSSFTFLGFLVLYARGVSARAL